MPLLIYLTGGVDASQADLSDDAFCEHVPPNTSVSSSCNKL